MKIGIVGATGRTGLQVVEQALARGDEVTAIARHAGAIARSGPGLTTAAVDVLDRAALIDALAGAEAVVSTVGIGSSRQPTVVYSQGTANLLYAMDMNGIAKLAAISAVPVGPWAAQPLLERRVILPILERVFRATYEDMRRMEALLADSEVGWVCLRPPRLVSKKATGHYRLGTSPLSKAKSLTFADLATALLDSLDRSDLSRQVAYVAN